MSYYQSNGDRTEAQLKKPGYVGGSAVPQRGDSFPALRGGGTGGPNPSASAPQVTPHVVANHVAATSSTPHPPPSTPHTPTEKGKAFEPSALSRGTSGVASNRGFATQPPVVPQQQLSARLPASKHGLKQNQPSMEVPQSTGQLAFPLQFGTISPGFMHNTGLQIPARTSSAPPNLDEQKREKAQFEAARASAATKAQTAVPSGPQEARGPHLPPQSPPASCLSSQVRPQVHLQPVQLGEAQNQPQQPRLHQHVPRPGLLHNQGSKFSQPMNLPQNSGQMLTPHVTHPIPGQFNHQRPPQIAHHLGPRASGPIAGQLPLGLPSSQYGSSITSPSPPLRPRTNRAVKIVNPKTHEELRFDSKMKSDVSADKVLPSISALSARLSNNAPAQPRVGVPFAGALHHQMNVNFFPGVQVGPYGPLGPPFYRPGLPTSSLPSAGVGLASNAPVRYGFTSPQGMPYVNHSVASVPAMSSSAVIGMVPSGPEHLVPDTNNPVGSNISGQNPYAGATQLATKGFSSSLTGRQGSHPPHLRAPGTVANQGGHDVKEKSRFENGGVVHQEYHALEGERPDTLIDASNKMLATMPSVEVLNQEQIVPAEVNVKCGTKQSEDVLRIFLDTNSINMLVDKSNADQVEANSMKGLQNSMEAASSEPSINVSAVELHTVSSTLNERVEYSSRIPEKNILFTEKEEPLNTINATDLGFTAGAAIIKTEKCPSKGDNVCISAPCMHIDEVEVIKVNPLQEQRSETPISGDSEVPHLTEDHLAPGDKNSDEPFSQSTHEQLMLASGITQEKEQTDIDVNASMCTSVTLCPTVIPVAETFVNEQINSSLVSDSSFSFEKSQSSSIERVFDLDSQAKASFTDVAHQIAEPKVGSSIHEHLENFYAEDIPSSIHFDRAVSSSRYPLETLNSTSDSTEVGDGLDNNSQNLQEAKMIGLDLGLQLSSTSSEGLTDALPLRGDSITLENSLMDATVNTDTDSRSYIAGDIDKSDSVAVDVSLSNFVPDNDQVYVPASVPTHSNKKKKKKAVFAKADAAGVTNDLYNAFKASKEVKQEEIMEGDKSSTDLLANQSRKDIMFGKVNKKELDDWEDVAESKGRTDGVEKTSTSVLSGITSSPATPSSRKYSRDFLLSFKELCFDLPARLEPRENASELFLNPGGAQFGVSADSGRNIDHQLNSTIRPERRSSGPDEDKWQPNPSPSLGYTEVHMNMGMVGSLGGFRPGQNLNMGLIARPVFKPGIPMPSSFMMGLVPGVALGNQMMGANATSIRTNGVDADRWERAPVMQKGIIPSPYTALPSIHKSEHRYEVGKVSDEEAGKQRQIKSILNKLTPQNFDKLFEKVKEVHIESANTLMGVISQIFDKALLEPTFCEMYAKFCVQLSKELPEFNEDGERVTFKRVLLNKCQEEFERGEREQEEAMKLTAEEREEKRLKARRRMLGNIRFIGELYKESMLTERIMHECIKKLLGGYQNPDEEDVEALCKLMGTIGLIIDHPKAKHHIDAYFDRMSELAVNEKLSSRLRFMLRDAIDLRKNGWQVRRKVEGPKKIDEVHRDAAHERQIQSGRDRVRGVSMGGVNRRLAPPFEFGMRGPPPPQYSSAQPIRNLQTQTGNRNTFGQDVRMEDRLLMENRPLPMTLSQRPTDEGSITLVPQGGLGRGLGMRAQPSVPGRSALADLSPAIHGDPRRSGMGPLSGYLGGTPDRGPFVGRGEHLSSRSSNSNNNNAERTDRPLLDRPVDRSNHIASSSDLHSFDRPTVEKISTSSSYLPAAMTPTRESGPVSQHLDEDQLRAKSELIITEYFSARDMKEAAQCVDELKVPKYHSTMVCDWVSKSLERKDADRECLVKLLIHLSSADPPLLSNGAVVHGFELVFGSLEDTSLDVPRAPEYVAGMFGKLIVQDILSLPQFCKLLRYGGLDPGSLIESGDSLKMLGTVMETLRQEKGEADMVDAYKALGLDLEVFVPRRNSKEEIIDTFLRSWNLQCLSPISSFEEQLRKALEKNQESVETFKSFEKNVPQAMFTDGSFPRMVMTQVLRHCIPSLPVDSDMNILKGRTRKYAPLLRMFSSGNANVVEARQRQYIVAVQLFVNDLGHPPGLMTVLFDNFYHEEVISERAYTKWQDDVKDSTPGRDKAIREVGKWLAWLATAPEEAADDD